jgi:hypothetical protein
MIITLLIMNEILETGSAGELVQGYGFTPRPSPDRPAWQQGSVASCQKFLERVFIN